MAPPNATQPKRGWIGDVVAFAITFGLLGAVYLLPPDMSLDQVKQSGRLTVCMPDLYPPLVTGDEATPGFDVELLGQVAERMGLRLAVITNPAMSRDFNPRTWRVTRAQCALLAGGVALSNQVLSYLDATPTHLATGWAVISASTLTSLEGKTVGFFAGLNGLDRVALSRQLRAEGIRARVVNSSAELARGLDDGRFDAGITEGLTAHQVAGGHQWQVAWLDAGGERIPLGIGLWKGDLTLKRAIAAEIDALRAEGKLEALQQKYDIADIDRVLATD